MIVYGDPSRDESPLSVLLELAATAAALTAGDSEQAMGFLIRAGELCQGLLDWKARDGAPESWGGLEQACAALLAEAARAFVSISEKTGSSDRKAIFRALARIGNEELPQTIRIKLPEGYAFYCVHPKAYWLAARECRSRIPGTWNVLGLRSIGTSLAAVVAEGLRSPLPAITFRPTGSPHARKIAVSEDLARVLLSDPFARFAIVDEGPGLSGSSFGALADWLEDHGVPRDRIHFFPSHSGAPGERSSARHRERWNSARRHSVAFETLCEQSDALAFLRRSEDLGAGGWRRKAYPDTRRWPPAHPQKERRKFLIEGKDGSLILAKFIGLGKSATPKLDMAEKLSAHGFTPPYLGYREGFLLERWIDCARLFDASSGRGSLLRTVREYLEFRAREFELPDQDGKDCLDRLFEMMVQNTSEELGAASAEQVRSRWQKKLTALSSRVHPIRIDGRMHSWEWLRTVDGRWIKCDALDHHQAHDCIGAQDLAWDVAGAQIELGLAIDFPDSELLRFHVDAYLAFHLGAYRMAADALLTSDRDEAWRLERQAERYASALAALLAGPGIANGCARRFF